MIELFPQKQKYLKIKILTYLDDIYKNINNKLMWQENQSLLDENLDNEISKTICEISKLYKISLLQQITNEERKKSIKEKYKQANNEN